MGLVPVQAVPVAEPEWSAGYKGLCLYVARVLAPAWEEPVLAPVSRNAAQLRPNIPDATLQVRAAFARQDQAFVFNSDKIYMCSERSPRSLAQPPVAGVAPFGEATYTDLLTDVDALWTTQGKAMPA